MPVQTPRILLLEDNLTHAELIALTLETGGLSCELVRVEARDDFVNACREQPFDLIIADYVLPEFNGLIALRLAREIIPEIPFILISGVLGEEFVVEALRNGATDYILKTRLSQLVPAVKRVLREAEERKARQRAEAALRESEERYRTLFENAIDGIVLCAADGIITGVNKSVEGLLGYRCEEIVGEHYEKFLASALKKEEEKRIRGALEGVEPTTFELEVMRQDGTILPLELRGQVLHDKEGNSEGFQVFLRDVSDRKTAERQRADFLAMLTHDIRTPIAAILGYAEILLDTTEAIVVAEGKMIAQRVRSNALSLHSLVTNYLDFSRIEAGALDIPKEPMAINEVIQRVRDRYAVEAAQLRITLQIHLQTDLPLILGAAIALERILANLLSNALKFTPAGGKVTIQSCQRGQAVTLEVADTGVGIAAENLPYVFEKYQTAGGRGGTGLGLFIVKSLVKAVGGKIAIKSTLNVGTRIIMTFPVAHCESACA